MKLIRKKLFCRIAEEGDIDDNSEGEEEEEEEDDSTEEMKKEKDILLMLYTELMGQPGALGAISSKLEEFGIKKTEEQVSEGHTKVTNCGMMILTK